MRHAKISVSIFLLLIMAVLALSLVSCGDLENAVTYTYELNENGEAVITKAQTALFGHMSPLAHAVIPESIDGYKVVEIADEAFYDTWIGDVVIPEGVRSIGERAFAGCMFLSSVSIPASVEYIGGGAFVGADDEFSLTLSSDNTSYKIIDGNLYSYNGDTFVAYFGKDENSFTVPEGVEVIAPYAFSDFATPAVVFLPEGLKVIEHHAFADSYVEYLTLPKSLLRIEDYAFFYCSVSHLDIPAGVEHIGEYVLSSYTSFTVEEGSGFFKTVDGSLFTLDGKRLIRFGSNKLIPEYSIPDGVEVIDPYAFAGSGNIFSINIPGSVREIKAHAFSEMDSIEAVTLPEGVVSIGAECFYNCNSLKTVSLPSTTVSIEFKVYESAFYGCDLLETIEIAEENPVYRSIDGVVFSKDRKKLFHYPMGKQAELYDVPNGTEVIGEGAFNNAVNICDVTFPNSLLIIEGDAFSYSGLDGELIIPDSVISIGEAAFACTSIESVTIGAGVSEIGERAFTWIGFFEAEFKDPDGWRAYSEYSERDIPSWRLKLDYFAAKCLGEKYDLYKWRKIG